jgi:photosystem II stability/assembly factor-like uncharacterized protein
VRFSADARLGVIVGDQVLLSRDGGVSWVVAATPPRALHGVSLSGDGIRVVAVGEGGLVWRSQDGGASFTETATGTTLALNAVGFDGDLSASGWVVGNGGALFVTDDAGEHLSALGSPLAADFTAVEDF